MNQKDRNHINRMKAIMKAIQPFIDEDKSCDFKCYNPHSSIIKQAYDSAKSEIKYTNEENDIYN